MNYAYLDEGLERWIYRTAHRNKWRVPSWYSLEDLISDGFVCYYKCYEKYGRLQRKRKPRKHDRRNFMALVKKTYENHITDLANQRTEQKEKAISQMLSPEQTLADWLEIHSVADAEVDYRKLIEEAPAPFRRLMTALITEARETAGYVKTKVGQYSVRETTNEKYCRLAGVCPEKHVDILEEVRHYFLASSAV